MCVCVSKCDGPINRWMDYGAANEDQLLCFCCVFTRLHQYCEVAGMCVFVALCVCVIRKGKFTHLCTLSDVRFPRILCAQHIAFTIKESRLLLCDGWSVRSLYTDPVYSKYDAIRTHSFVFVGLLGMGVVCVFFGHMNHTRCA